MKSFSAVFLFVATVSFFITGCVRETFVSSADRHIQYEGRIKTTARNVVFFWPGSSAKIVVKGRGKVFAVLKDENGKNYYDIILDRDPIRVLHPDTLKQRYLLASFDGGTHSVQLFKRTEWDKGYTLFYGFVLQGNLQIINPPQKKHLKLEFYGNSITAGYAVDDDPSHSHPDSIFTNNYDSYAAITARYFHADYRCICKSGIGILISWFPLTMPQLYNRLNPVDSLSRWDFKKYTPDVVVINLLQNDSWLVNRPSFPEFKKKFGTRPPSPETIIQAYKNFVLKIRKAYPRAKIICMLGNMDITRKGSPWPGYVKKAVQQMHDKKVYTLFVPYKNTPGHPGRHEQQVLADSLIGKIKRINAFR